MVSVPLIDLVLVHGTKHLWPPDFVSFVEAIEANPDERTPYGACADWLEEEGRDEKDLARAFRYIAKRPNLKVIRGGVDNRYFFWRIDGVPYTIDRTLTGDVDTSTVAGALGGLATNIKAALEELS